LGTKDGDLAVRIRKEPRHSEGGMQRGAYERFPTDREEALEAKQDSPREKEGGNTKGKE